MSASTVLPSATAGAAWREAAITDHVPLVGYIVNEIGMRLPVHVDRDDLRSAGLIGLVQAADAYKAEMGVPFRHYANSRIRGAVMDELRRSDWATRSVRAAGRDRDGAVDRLTATLGRTPSASEVAAYLGVSVDELRSTESALQRGAVLSLDAAPSPDAMEDVLPLDSSPVAPEDHLLDNETLDYLKAAVAVLPDRLRAVVTGYFLEGRPMAELASELNVTESRISQLRAEALILLRDGMNAHLDPERLPEEARPNGVVARRRASYFAAIAQRRLIDAQGDAGATADSPAGLSSTVEVA